MVADNIDLPYLSPVAFLHIDANRNGVIWSVGDTGFNRDTVLAPVVILLSQELLHIVEHRAVERATARKSDVAKRVHQILGLDVLIALHRKTLDRRPLPDHDDERIPITAHFDVIEQRLTIK